MKPKHTPGNWYVTHIHDGEEIIASDCEEYIGTVKHQDDARLIASAPDLLASLKRAQARLCEFCPQYIDARAEQVGDHLDECLEAMDAIAKAEGRE